MELVIFKFGKTYIIKHLWGIFPYPHDIFSLNPIFSSEIKSQYRHVSNQLVNAFM